MRKIVKNRTFLEFATIAIVLGVLYFSTLSLRPLGNPDEGRYGEIPREMLQTGDFLTPRLNGVLYFEKPPLTYWFNALSMKVGGFSHFFLRFFNTFQAVLSCLIMYFAGRYLYSRTVGIFASLILGTSGVFFGVGQIVGVDMQLTFFMSASLILFITARTQKKPNLRKWMLRGFYVCMSLAVMTKGLIGVLIPSCIIFLWILVLGLWRELKTYRIGEGFIISLLVAGPWHLFMVIKHKMFAWFYFVKEHFLRYTTTTHNRGRPWWFLIAAYTLGMYPWMMFFPQAMKFSFNRKLKNYPTEVFLLIWILFVIAFFTVSNSKLIPYILPILPPTALLLGKYLASVWQGNTESSSRISFWLIGISMILSAIIAPFVLIKKTRLDVPVSEIHIYKILPVILIIGGVFIIWNTRKKMYKKALAGTMCTVVVLLFGLTFVMECVQRPSTKQFAMLLKPALSQDSKVFCIYDYYQDLPFYIEKKVGIVAHVPDEQGLGYSIEPGKFKDRYINMNKFLEVFAGEEPVYALAKTQDYANLEKKIQNSKSKLFKLKANKNFTLFSNKIYLVANH